MLSDVLTDAKRVTISTGNVLNLIDIKKKAGQNVAEELTESLKITISEWENSSNLINNDISHENNGVDSRKDSVIVSRSHDDVKTKMGEDDRKNLKIGVKIFVNDDCVASLTECLDNVYKTLNIEMIENVVLAYNPPHPSSDVVNGGGKHAANDKSNPSDDADASEGKEPDSSKCDHILPGLRVLWSTLQEYVKQGKIIQLGVSDLDEACFKRLHETSEIKPSIVQINLSSCCVVPPGLQKFCKDNDIQLLTHSDPQEIITKETLTGMLGRQSTMRWCVRYQVHIKCRGVLALKGFITSATV